MKEKKSKYETLAELIEFVIDAHYCSEVGPSADRCFYAIDGIFDMVIQEKHPGPRNGDVLLEFLEKYNVEYDGGPTVQDMLKAGFVTTPSGYMQAGIKDDKIIAPPIPYEEWLKQQGEGI